jgi:tyrosinase
MDVRQNFAKMSSADRKRVIEAIKWMKVHDRGGVDGATVLTDGDPGFLKGGVYQRYVRFHSQGQVTGDLSSFTITRTADAATTLKSVIIDNEEWVSTSNQPLTDVGLRAFLDEIPLSGSGPSLTAPDIGGHSGGRLNVRSVPPPLSSIDPFTGHIDKCPFANIKIRTIPSGSTTPVELTLSRTVTGAAAYRLDTFQMAHRSPNFLPWHRVFLRLFEKDLQFADKQNHNDGKITLPYWNWIRDTDWDETSKSSVWHKENFGGFSDDTEGAIKGDHFSPASGWQLFDGTPPAPLAGVDGQLRRRRIADRSAPDGQFPTVATAKPVVNNKLYRSSAGRQFAGQFEQALHDVVHMVVGGLKSGARTKIGQMSNMLLSPQDPVFWLFHCYVDRVWSRWQWFYDKAEEKDEGYPHFGQLPGRRRNDPMQPWAGPTVPPYQFNVRVDDVLNAANFSSAVNASNLLGKGYQYDSLKL